MSSAPRHWEDPCNGCVKFEFNDKVIAYDKRFCAETIPPTFLKTYFNLHYLYCNLFFLLVPNMVGLTNFEQKNKTEKILSVIIKTLVKNNFFLKLAFFFLNFRFWVEWNILILQLRFIIFDIYMTFWDKKKYFYFQLWGYNESCCYIVGWRCTSKL